MLEFELPVGLDLHDIAVFKEISWRYLWTNAHTVPIHEGAIDRPPVADVYVTDGRVPVVDDSVDLTMIA